MNQVESGRAELFNSFGKEFWLSETCGMEVAGSMFKCSSQAGVKNDDIVCRNKSHKAGSTAVLI
jgi:hypothetical protein